MSKKMDISSESIDIQAALTFMLRMENDKDAPVSKAPRERPEPQAGAKGA